VFKAKNGGEERRNKRGQSRGSQKAINVGRCWMGNQVVPKAKNGTKKRQESKGHCQWGGSNKAQSIHGDIGDENNLGPKQKNGREEKKKDKNGRKNMVDTIAEAATLIPQSACADFTPGRTLSLRESY
jgi:hypothetical protein